MPSPRKINNTWIILSVVSSISAIITYISDAFVTSMVFLVFFIFGVQKCLSYRYPDNIVVKIFKENKL